MKRKVVFLCLMSCLMIIAAGRAANAAWIPDGVEMAPYLTPVPQAAVIAPDGAGGAIMVWADGRSGNSDIYAQRADSLGTALWTAGGIAVCADAAYRTDPRIVSDGAGGAILTWIDYRSGNSDI
jgi:hypothetical protein